MRVEESCQKSDSEKIIEKVDELSKDISTAAKKAVKNTRKKVQDIIATNKPDSASFDRIKELSNAKIKTLLKEIDAENLLYALQDATDEVRDKVLPNLTKTAKAEYDRLSEGIKKIRKSDIAKSRKIIAEKISRFFS
ncbi:MAG TPA: FliG C-terminal domain-containing protein [Bacteroidales bacterium]|nr:FliG C-terminal domain-containing protein [Bacteroidales bacterium]